MHTDTKADLHLLIERAKTDDHSLGKIIKLYLNRYIKLTIEYWRGNLDELTLESAIIEGIQNAVKCFKPDGNWEALLKISIKQKIDYQARAKKHKLLDIVDFENENIHPICEIDGKTFDQRNHDETTALDDQLFDSELLNDREEFLLSLYRAGYRVDDIAIILNAHRVNVSKALAKILKKLSE